MTWGYQLMGNIWGKIYKRGAENGVKGGKRKRKRGKGMKIGE
jgi:hypothetical protein